MPSSATTFARIALSNLQKGLRRSGVGSLPILSAGREWLKSTRLGRRLIEDVPTDVGEFYLHLPRRFRRHYLDAPYEATSQRTVVETIRPGMTVVDVGAHIGFFTVLCGRRVGPSGRVVAIEPAQENLRFLQRNIALNGLENVRVVSGAAGRETSIRRFNVTGSSDSHGFYSHPLTESVATVEVQQVALDELIEGPVHAVKIDVEGAELEVLDGMTRILRGNTSLTLWVEWNPACMRSAGYEPRELPDRLRQEGFTVEVIDDQEGHIYSVEEGLQRAEAAPDHWYVNLWARRA